MGGKPAVLKRLEKGKIIDAQVGFVDTFNFLVDFINHLQGDADQDEGGAIQVDRTLEDFPVIRFLGSTGGGGEGGGKGVANFDFDPETKSISNGVVCIARQYRLVTGMTNVTDGSYRLKFTIGSSSVTVVLEKGDGFADPSDTVSYAPLYKIENGAISEDYRAALYLMIRE